MAKDNGQQNQGGGDPPATNEKPKGPSKNVLVEVYEAVSFGGVRVAPNVDDAGKVTPGKAIIPRAIAKVHPKSRLKILKPADDDAKIGQVAEK